MKKCQLSTETSGEKICGFNIDGAFGSDQPASDRPRCDRAVAFDLQSKALAGGGGGRGGEGGERRAWQQRLLRPARSLAGTRWSDNRDK